MINTETKLCSCCKEVKPVTEFRKRGRNNPKLQSRCKRCQTIKRMEWEDKMKSDPKMKYIFKQQMGASVRRYRLKHPTPKLHERYDAILKLI